VKAPTLPHRVAVFLAAATLWLPAGQPSAAQVDERAMKAAFLYNFIQFTQWPAAATGPFTLCVLGSTPMDQALDGLAGKPVLGSQTITVRHVQMQDELQSCRALFLPEDHASQADLLVNRLGNAPVLTVTDADGLADRGVMIELRRRDRRFVFDVNLNAAKKAALTFSSRMLSLASFVSGVE